VARLDELYRTWLELVGQILHQPLGLSLRHEEQLLHLLDESFDGACSTRNRSPAPENQILDCCPLNHNPDAPPRGYYFRQKPLLRWYAFAGRTEPRSFARAPGAVTSSRLQQGWVARPWNVNRQLSIPFPLAGSDYDAYLISRPDRDFTEQEVDLAILLQPILTGLALHLGLAPTSAAASVQRSAHALTLREMAILTLLGRGLTAESLARRLGISPRTVGKHLEHIYRKLDVSDRLMAVQRAHELGLIITEEEHEVVLTEGRPVIEKEAVPVERVRLDKETVTEQQTVDGQVREERVEVEGDGTHH
jgi:DNA-binding CsgD family transcriptional regulator